MHHFQVLHDTLEADFTAHSLVSDILHSLVYGVMAVLVQAFDPASMGLGVDTHNIVVKLLSHRLIAAQFWKDPQGLSVYFDDLKSQFPLNQASFMEVCKSLASASKTSCSNLVSTLSNLTSLTDNVDNLPQNGLKSLGDGRYELTRVHYPYPGTHTVCVPARTHGHLLANGVTVKFDTEQNGWQIMLAEIGHLSSQLESGAGYVSSDCLKKVTRIAGVIAAVSSCDPALCSQLDQIITALTAVSDKFSSTPAPPLQLVAAVLDTLAAVAVVSPAAAAAKLEHTSLLPRRSPAGVLSAGAVGQLLAGQETVAGEFPSLLAFLKLVTLMANQV